MSVHFEVRSKLEKEVSHSGVFVIPSFQSLRDVVEKLFVERGDELNVGEQRVDVCLSQHISLWNLGELNERSNVNITQYLERLHITLLRRLNLCCHPISNSCSFFRFFFLSQFFLWFIVGSLERSRGRSSRMRKLRRRGTGTRSQRNEGGKCNGTHQSRHGHAPCHSHSNSRARVRSTT